MAAATSLRVDDDTKYAQFYFSQLQGMITKANHVYEEVQFDFHFKYLESVDNHFIVRARSDFTLCRFSKNVVETQPNMVLDFLKKVNRDMVAPSTSISGCGYIWFTCDITFVEKPQ